MPEAGGDDLPIINMLWVEGHLGVMERACIRSVMAQGHRLVLWHYGPLENIPEGVELRSGEDVVPSSRIIRHVPTGSYALFSNLFRYRLLQLGMGLWLDTDMYLLKPIPKGNGHIYGFGEPGIVASGVLDLPSDSPVLEELIAFYDARRIPPWLPLRWRLRFALQRALRGKYRLETMPWGNLGPVAVTRLIEKYGLEAHIQAQSVFSPVSWPEADWVFDPAMAIDQVAQPDTLAVHLFNQMIRARKNDVPPAGSFAERLHREGA